MEQKLDPLINSHISYRTMNNIINPYVFDMEPETISQKARIIADGGAVIDLQFMNTVIKTLKNQGIYGNAKMILDANIGVKKNGAGVIDKLYDISGNNNDAVQTVAGSKPTWSAPGGKGIIRYDGGDYLVFTPIMASYVFSVCQIVSQNYTGYSSIYSNGGDLNNIRAQSTALRTILNGANVNDFVYPAGNTRVNTVIGYDMPFGVTKLITVANTTQKQITWIGAGCPERNLNGYLNLSMVFDVVPSDSVRIAIESMINQYYSIY